MGQLTRLLLGTVLLVQTAFAADAAAVDTDAELSRTWSGKKYKCKCYTGDKCWPKANDWKNLNSTVDGNLLVHIPPEAVCHNTFQGPLGNVATYDAAKCAAVTATYADEQWSCVL
jgi:hypothetical protein